MKPTTVSIVIPVYNEEKYIVPVLEKVISANTGTLRKEIVVVDDGSTDETVDKIISFLKTSKKQSKNSRLDSYSELVFELPVCKVVVIINKSNNGKCAALKQGFIKTTGDIVVVQDADFEYDPSDYEILFKPFFTFSADVVYGSRFISGQPRRVLFFWHSIVNNFLTTFSNLLTGLNLSDMETGYKVFRGDLIRAIAPKLSSKRFGFEPEITARVAKVPGIKIFEVGISYSGRTYEEGKKIGWRDGVQALLEIIRYRF